MPVPLVLNLHGYGSNSNQEEALSGISAKADKEGFLVIYPDGLNAAWHTGPERDGKEDRQFVRDLIAESGARTSIDPRP